LEKWPAAIFRTSASFPPAKSVVFAGSPASWLLKRTEGTAMYLSLEVVSPQAASLGAERRRTVGPAGLTIGRIPGNDWIFPDPYISKRHARISYSNGAFYVEGLGRNAIAIGSIGNALPPNKPQPLRNGDRLFIDQYEIIVTTLQGEPPGAALAIDDPFAVLPPNDKGDLGPTQPSSAPDVWNGGVAGDLVETGVLDPLAVLGGAARSKEPEPLPPVNWQRASALEDHIDLPPIKLPAAGHPFDLLKPEPESLAPPPQPGGIPDNWDRTNFNLRGGTSQAQKAPAQPVEREPVPQGTLKPRPVTPAPGGRSANRELPPAVRNLGPDPNMPRSSGAIPAAPVRADPSHGATLDPGSELAALLRGAGLSAQDMSPEVMRDLGRVLRVVVEGVMDVLRARAEIKSQFRLPMTRIQSAENNPLKHSPNVESALHTLLVQRNPGYLSSVQAFEDAFDDIRNHQMAMLEGLRTAYESMLESFDPKKLEKNFERVGKRGLGFGSAKSKYWDLYTDRFAHLGSDADDTFRRLFGDVFAEAYEKQLERLKRLGAQNDKS
jgi:type VI secretion system FHA domain protein